MHDHEPINLTLLQTFQEVARTGSVTRAARELCRSQPAVSHRLRTLERDLGVRLFERVAGKLRLTEHGRRLQGECVELMTRSLHLRERVLGRDGPVVGRVVLGTLPTLASHMLAPALSEMLVEHTGIALEFDFGYVPYLLERLRSGELDVVVSIGELSDPAFDVRLLGTIELAVALPNEIAPPDASVSPDWLCDHRYLAFGGLSDPTFDRIDAFAGQFGLASPSSPRVPHTETLRELVVAGAGYALLPSYTLRRDVELGRLSSRRVRGLDARLPLVQATRRASVVTPALEVLTGVLSGVGAEVF